MTESSQPHRPALEWPCSPFSLLFLRSSLFLSIILCLQRIFKLLFFFFFWKELPGHVFNFTLIIRLFICLTKIFDFRSLLFMSHIYHTENFGGDFLGDLFLSFLIQFRAHLHSFRELEGWLILFLKLMLFSLLERLVCPYRTSNHLLPKRKMQSSVRHLRSLDFFMFIFVHFKMEPGFYWLFREILWPFKGWAVFPGAVWSSQLLSICSFSGRASPSSLCFFMTWGILWTTDIQFHKEHWFHQWN